MFPENYPLLAVGVQGCIALLMGIKMSQLRVSQLAAKQKVGEGPAFKQWHVAQLNSAEYHPLFMALYLAVFVAAKLANKPLRQASEIGITLGLLGTVFFIFGATQSSPKGPTPFRVLGAACRYIAIAILSYEVTQYY